MTARAESSLLLASVFVVATCGLIYELLAGALSSYLLGSSITHFSIVIGLFLFAMGIGSLGSRFVREDLLRTFVLVEILVGFIGGSSTLLLFFAFAQLGDIVPLLVVLCLIVGALVGLEVPLLIRILRREFSFGEAVSNVLALDYLGALVASLLFPLLLIPHLGLIRTGFLFGLLNVVVALLGLHVFRRQLRRAWPLRVGAWAAAATMIVGLITAGFTTNRLEDSLYDDEIVYAKTTPFQRLVLTRWRDDLRLFINGNVQFSSTDEFRYHEALIHPAMTIARHVKRVLVLGGGDGLAVREILKYASVERVDVVDLDPEMTRIFSQLEPLRALNHDALNDERVHLHNVDAQRFLQTDRKMYDVIAIDLPDPNDEGLGKLYTRSFYRLVTKHLTQRGALVTQATSPFYARQAFWCIVNTLDEATPFSGGPSLNVLPYHVNVPSFGDWGFVVASLHPISAQDAEVRVPTRYLSNEVLATLFVFPKDLARQATPTNRLDDQVLVRLYEAGYRHYNQ